MAVDLPRVQRNVQKMLDQGASVPEVDSYLRVEKVTPGMLRAYSKRAKSYGAGDLVENRVTFGLADRVKAIGTALDPNIDYGEALAAERAAREGYQAQNPVVSAVTAPLAIFSGGPAATGMSALRAATVGGAVGGAAQGYAESERPSVAGQLADTALGAGVGAVAGRTIARYAPAVVSRLTNAAKPVIRKAGEVLRPRTSAVEAGMDQAVDAADPRAAARAVYEAAKRQGVRVLPADVGGVGTRMATGAVGRTLGGLPLANASQAAINSVAAARNRVAAQAGQAADDATGAGQVVQRGVRRFMEDSEKRGNKLFEGIPIAGEREASINGTRATLADLTAEMSSNPELSEFFRNPKLEGYLAALTPKAEKQATGVLDASGNVISRTVEKGGKLNWRDLKEFRTRVGDMLSDARLSPKIPERQLRALYKSLSEDMEATAKASGPQAYAAWRRANNFWDGRQKRIDDVIAAVVGQRKDMTANEAYAQIERWAGTGASGDFARLGRVLRTMPKEDAAVVRATITSRLGNAKAGAQGAEGETFSPAEFATHWNKMSPRAKSFLFNDPKVRSALDDLAKVTADGMKNANAYQNFSNTSLGTNTVAAAFGSVTAPFATAALAGASYGAGKLLSSEAMVRWLTRAAKIEAARPGVTDALKSHVGQLAAIAARESAIRSEVLALQQRLTDAFSQPVSKLAAEQQNAPEAEEQPEQQGEAERPADPREKAITVRLGGQ